MYKNSKKEQKNKQLNGVKKKKSISEKYITTTKKIKPKGYSHQKKKKLYLRIQSVKDFAKTKLLSSLR